MIFAPSKTCLAAAVLSLLVAASRLPTANGKKTSLTIHDTTLLSGQICFDKMIQATQVDSSYFYY